MDLRTLLGIALFTVAVVFTVLSWREFLGDARSKEGFASPGGGGGKDTRMSSSVLSDEVVAMIAKQREPKAPTDQDADAAHQTLLRYIQSDYSKGVKFVMDMRDRFFGSNVPIRPDLDVRTLMDNYHSPLQRL